MTSPSSLKKHLVIHYTDAIARESGMDSSPRCPYCQYYGKYRWDVMKSDTSKYVNRHIP